MKLPVSQLIQDFSLYPREAVDVVHVEAIMEAMRAGVVMPAVVIDAESKWIVDGFHRVHAFIRIHEGDDDAEIEVVQKKYRDARDLFLDAVRLNAHHGRPFCQVDRAKALGLAEQLKIDQTAILKSLGITAPMAQHLRVTNGSTLTKALFQPAQPRTRYGVMAAGAAISQPTERTNRVATQSPQKSPAEPHWTKLRMVEGVISAIEAGGVDTGNKPLMQAIVRLGELLDQFRVIPATVQNGYGVQNKLSHELLELAWKGTDVAQGNLPYFPFYVRDFVADGKVESMSTEEVGAYVLLLCKAWHETPPCSIPNNDAVLSRWSRIEPQRWAACRIAVLHCWTLNAQDNRYYQKRLQSEYRKLRELQNLRSRAGVKGNTKRWHSDRKAISRASESESESESPTVDVSHQPRARERTPRDDLFDAVAEVCSVDIRAKSNAGRVAKAVNSLVDLEATPDDVRTRAARYRANWPNVACTPSALVAHWGEFAVARSGGNARTKAASDADERRAAKDQREFGETPTAVRVRKATGQVETVVFGDGDSGAQSPGSQSLRPDVADGHTQAA